MNNAELQAIQDKRNANLQKLQNYLNAGKDATEGVVKKVIKDIRKAEATLLENNVVLDTTIDDNGNLVAVESTKIVDSTVHEKNTTTEPTNNIEDKDDAPVEVKTSTSNKPKRTMNNEKKKAVEKFGVSIRADIKKKVDDLGKSSNNLKPNTVVVNLLEEIFDGKKFNIAFEKKAATKITSFNLPVEMINAIDKINEKTNIPKSEIFNKLLEEALKNYY